KTPRPEPSCCTVFSPALRRIASFQQSSTMRKFLLLLLVLTWSRLPLLARTDPNPAAPRPSPLQQTAKPLQSAALKSRLAIESGNKLREKQDFSAALRAYHQAITLEPENSNAWFYLGIA